MKTKPSTLKLRAHSIRTLTPGELRVVNGGVIDPCCGSIVKLTVARKP
jgi:hypothetical protein